MLYSSHYLAHVSLFLNLWLILWDSLTCQALPEVDRRSHWHGELHGLYEIGRLNACNCNEYEPLHSVHSGEASGSNYALHIQLNPLTSFDASHSLNSQALPGIQ